MIGHAQAAHPTGAHSPGARYVVDDAQTLATVPTATVDRVTAGLSLNNVPDLPAALTAVRRVLRPWGHLVLTVPRPCFEAPHAGWTTDDNGTPDAALAADRPNRAGLPPFLLVRACWAYCA
ncbi:methyltransferase domain-containing protein [Streptomyces sp. NBC_01537]|uniref:class I SAM-dependent methyltransferase n=1 Tax=Streptomyces sp. NBC_01537 TaxID=2903896 RepID=UPI003866BF03